MRIGVRAEFHLAVSDRFISRVVIAHGKHFRKPSLTIHQAEHLNSERDQRGEPDG